jgi:hypothetical protein
MEEAARAFHVGAAPPQVSHLIYARPLTEYRRH